MKHTPRNILGHELIGLRAEVVESRDPSLVGLAGVIVDETKNTVRVDGEDGLTKTISKRVASLKVYLPFGDMVVVDGGALQGRPEDRLLARWRR